MVGLKINLFGEFRVRRGEGPIGTEEWGGQKPRSLLKLLLTHPGRVFSRDEIVEALWPGVSPEAADRRLRITVSLLRRALEPDLERGPRSRYVLGRRPGYAFNLEADCWVDAWEFEERRARADDACRDGKLDEAIEQYRSALDLVEGEFLEEDSYEEWTMEARQQWQACQLSILSDLSECLAQRGRYTEAIEICERALALDEYGEELHRRLMLYRYCAGEQALALKAYRNYARMIDRELGTCPSPGLVRLKEQMEVRNVPGVDEGRRRYPRPRRPLRFPYSLGRTHFAGRDGEYAWLVERLREAMEGIGGAVAIEGEAGVGKTRLVEEFLGYARSQGVRVLSGRCYERELGPPLEPVIEALGPVVDADEAGAPVLSRVGEEIGLWDAGPTRAITHAYHAMTRRLIEESRGYERGALVLFLDDVQWADPATLDFLSYLTRRIVPERVLLIFAYRQEDSLRLSGWLSGLSERRTVRTLRLDRLSPGDLARILSDISSRSFEALAHLVSFLHRESEGNPFYAIEYLRWLIESDAVEIDSRRRISGLKDEAFQEGALPSSVQSLIKARLSSLDDGTKNLLELAAVVGRTFDLGLLSRAAALGESGASGAIEPLKSSGLIVEAAEEAYYFSHDKLRQTLYEGIDGRRRREMHLQVAMALERDGGEPAELAHHYLRAGEWEPALENLMRAGRRAEEGYAWETALDNYTRALEVLEKLPRSGERRFELLAFRERLLEHMDRQGERAAVVREMFELARSLGDRVRLAEVYMRRIGVLMALSEPDGAERVGQAAVSILQELGDKAGEARAYRELGYVLWVSGEHDGALEANFEALRVHRELDDRSSEAGDMGNIAQVYRGMKRFDEALRWAQKAARMDRELGDRLGESFRLNTIATIHQEWGELKSALSLHLRALALVTELGAKNLRVVQHMNCGRLHLRLEDPRGALEHFQAGGRLGREMGYSRDEGYSLVNVGVALERLEDLTGAEEAYRRAVGLLATAYEESGSSEELFGKAEALTLLGRVLHRSLDRPEEALEAYEEAVGIYRGFGNTERLRKLLLGEGGLLWKTGDLEESARRYEEALTLAREQEEAAHEAVALASLGVVYRDLGSLKESLRRGREARDLLRGLGDFQTESYILSSLAESYGRLGHHKSALSCLKRSLRLRRQIGDGEGEIGVLRDLAKVYDELQDAERARICLQEATRTASAPKKTSVGRDEKRRG